MPVKPLLFLLAALSAPAPVQGQRPMEGPLEKTVSADTARFPPESHDALDALISEALRNNRGLKAAESRVEALRSAPGRAWHLEPPEIAVEFFQAPIPSFPNPLEDQMEVDYSLQQSFPFPGKIASRMAAGRSGTRVGEAEAEAARRRVIREVKTRYYELYLLDRRLEFNRDDQALMNRLIDIARRQYEVGMGRQTDILRAQTELTRLKTDSIALAQGRRAMEGMLNALLDRRTSRPVRVADTLRPARIDWEPDQLILVLREHHPGLKAMRASVEMRKAERAMAGREFFPDIMVRGAYKDMLAPPPGLHAGAPGDAWSIMVGMDLPLAFWSAPAYKAGAAQSRAALSQARHEYSDAENMASARAQEALLKARSSAELARLSRSAFLPQAQQALESSLAAYQGGRGEFLGLLDAYRMRLMARQDVETALMQLMVSQAELEEAIGLGLDEIREKLSRGAMK